MSNKQFSDELDFPPISGPSGKPVLRTLNPSEQSGASNPISFIELADTPPNYLGYNGYVPIVINENALVFTLLNHASLPDTHNLTSDIDHNLILNYEAEQHIRWDLTGAENIHIDRIDIASISHPDDDFNVNLSLKASIVSGDELLIADSEDIFNYKRILYSDLIDGLSTIVSAYSSITADNGITSLPADGATEIVISGDGLIIETVGSIPFSNTLSLSFLPQSPASFLAGPVSGVSDTPSFRTLSDTDMPVSYEPVNWGSAYAHILDETNPHNVDINDIGGWYEFDYDIPVVLSSGRSLGKYTNGDTIPSTGKTLDQVIADIATEYLDASFTAFNVTGQATTVEVGTELTGSKTFTWSINEGSGSVELLDINDITLGSDLETNLDIDPDPGTYATTVTTNKLSSEGNQQQWKLVGTDITPLPDVDFDSSTFTVTARYYRFYGPRSAIPTDDTTTRTLPEIDWQTGTDVFDLWTGITEKLFYVALPPGVVITSVIDITAIGADITTEYIDTGNVTIVDADGQNATYKLYEMSIGGAYDISHQHRITAG